MCSAINNEFSHQDGVSLKQYMDIRFTALEDRIKAVENISKVMSENIEESTTLAKAGIDKRLNGIDKVGGDLRALTSTFICRDEHSAMVSKFDKDIRYLRELAATAEGKASMKQVYIAWAFGFGGFFLGLAGLLIRFIH